MHAGLVAYVFAACLWVTVHHAIPTGKYSTNYKAGAEALRTAISALMDNMEAMAFTPTRALSACFL